MIKCTAAYSTQKPFWILANKQFSICLFPDPYVQFKCLDPHVRLSLSLFILHSFIFCLLRDASSVLRVCVRMSQAILSLSVHPYPLVNSLSRPHLF